MGVRRPRAASDAAVAAAVAAAWSLEPQWQTIPDDADELERVDDAKPKRRKSQSKESAPVGRPRKKRKESESAAAAGDSDDDGAPVIASAAARSIASRARATAESDSLPMSRVAAAEHSTTLTYFDQLSAPAKSKNTLRDVAKLTPEERARIAAALPVRNPEAKARLMEYHRSGMREWYLQLRAGYNLLAYGFGSKKQLLSEFARDWLTDGPVIVMNGYYPAANVKNLLNVLTRDLMNLPSQTFRDLQSHVEFVRDWFRNDARMAAGGRRGRVSHAQDQDSDSDDDAAHSSSAAFLPHVYILLHNIDGASLRSESQQHILSLLSSIPQVHLVASVDHILSGWLWDQSLIDHFQFVHHDCTTFAAYDAEFLFASNSDGAGGRGTDGSGALVDASQSGRAAGIGNVLSSLTPNHRKVLDVLAREQLTPSNANFLEGTTFVTRAAFLNACEENMLVANAASFDRLLSELRDHRLVEEKVVQRTRVVHIPYASFVIRRHILGESEEDAAVQEAAAAAAEAEASEARRQAANPFAQAIGFDAHPTGEEDDEDDDDEDEEDGDA